MEDTNPHAFVGFIFGALVSYPIDAIAIAQPSQGLTLSAAS